MKPGTKNSYNSLSEIIINSKKYKYYSLSKAESNGLKGISKLPKSLKVLLENLDFCLTGLTYGYVPENYAYLFGNRVPAAGE